MSKNDEVLAAEAAFSTSLSAMKQRYQDLVDQLENTAGDGLNAEQTEALLATLNGWIAAADASNPTVPGNPPAPVLTADPQIPGPFTDANRAQELFSKVTARAKDMNTQRQQTRTNRGTRADGSPLRPGDAGYDQHGTRADGTPLRPGDAGYDDATRQGRTGR